MNTAPDIITAIRNKLSHIHNTTGTPHKGALYLGRAQWEQLEKHAREEWVVPVKSHRTTWVAGTPVKLEDKIRDGIYTSEEVNEVFALRKANSLPCIDSSIPDIQLPE